MKVLWRKTIYGSTSHKCSFARWQNKQHSVLYNPKSCSTNSFLNREVRIMWKNPKEIIVGRPWCKFCRWIMHKCWHEYKFYRHPCGSALHMMQMPQDLICKVHLCPWIVNLDHQLWIKISYISQSLRAFELNFWRMHNTFSKDWLSIQDIHWVWWKRKVWEKHKSASQLWIELQALFVPHVAYNIARQSIYKRGNT